MFIIYKTSITKPCTHLHQAPFSSTQLHPAPSSSTQLHPPPPSSFQLPPSSLQHPQQYLNQNIARNWTISPNLGQKNEELSILTENWDVRYIGGVDSEPRVRFLKIHFWANLGPKFQSYPLCLKIGIHSISRMLILNRGLEF